MQYALISVPMVLLFLYGVYIRLLKGLELEVGFLPEAKKTGPNGAVPHSAVGSNLNSLTGIPFLKDNPYTVLMVGSLTCSACPREFDEFVHHYNLDGVMPFGALLLGSEDPERDVVDKFGKQVPAVRIEETFVQTLRIQFIPSFILVDAKGNILSVKMSAQAISIAYNQLLKGGEKNVE